MAEPFGPAYALALGKGIQTLLLKERLSHLNTTVSRAVFPMSPSKQLSVRDQLEPLDSYNPESDSRSSLVSNLPIIRQMFISVG